MRMLSLFPPVFLAAGILAGTLPGYTISYEGSKACDECHGAKFNSYSYHTHATVKGPIPDETGIGCESCHGSGVNHISHPLSDLQSRAENGDPMDIDIADMTTCGGCHGRVKETTVKLASDYLLQYMQSYNELKIAGKMSANTCMTCHEPHMSSKTPDGFVATCANCHAQTVKISQMAGKVTCRDCHMPLAVSTGKGTMVKEYQKGEHRAHLFTISVDPAYKLNDGSGNAAVTKDGRVQLTVEMTCYACHQTGAAPALSRAELLANTVKMHN